MLPLSSTAIQIPAKIHQPFLPLKQKHRCIISYTEIEFLNGIFSRGFGHKHGSSQNNHEKTLGFLFRRFFCKDFYKPEKSMVYFKIRQ
jgi:hypothetical protein